MKLVPQNPYWERHSPANGQGVPEHPSCSLIPAPSVGAGDGMGVTGAGVAGAKVNGGLVGRSVGLSNSGTPTSRQLVNAKHRWLAGQSSLFDEGQRMAQPELACSQSVPQKKVASGSVGEYTSTVGFRVGLGVVGSRVGLGVGMAVGTDVGVRVGLRVGMGVAVSWFCTFAFFTVPSEIVD